MITLIRLEDLDEEKTETDAMFHQLEVDVDSLRKELYKDFQPEIQEMTPIDADSEHAVIERPPPPPSGELQRPALKVGMKVLAMRHDLLQIWKEATIEDEIVVGDVKEYRVKFEEMQGNKRKSQLKQLALRNLAYHPVSSVRLTVGTRCLGLYKDQPSKLGAFYSGVIAEPPKSLNRNRYLVFFDDGYANYICHENLRVVCTQTSPQVWTDVHPNSQEFVQTYLERYPERPMVRLSPGQQVKAESGRSWLATRVVTVDASLVKVKYSAELSQQYLSNFSCFSCFLRKTNEWSGFTAAPPDWLHSSLSLTTSAGGSWRRRRWKGPGRPFLGDIKLLPARRRTVRISSTGETARRLTSQTVRQVVEVEGVVENLPSDMWPGSPQLSRRSLSQAPSRSGRRRGPSSRPS